MDYDEQIEYLTKNPEDIERHWLKAKGLFKVIGKESGAGCLTTLRIGCGHAFIKGVLDNDLRTEIANDERIPKSASEITVEHFPVFKEWQEKIDKLQSA